MKITYGKHTFRIVCFPYVILVVEKIVAKEVENKTAVICLCRENFWWEKGNGNILKSRMADTV